MYLSRAGWLLATLASLSVWLIAPAAGSACADISGPDFPQALLGLASLTQLAVSGWVLLVIAVSQLHGASPVFTAIAPATLRRALFIGAASAIAVAPAHADQGAEPVPSVHVHSLDGLSLPDRPAVRIEPDVVVKPGDTLWAIAARSLPAGSGDADIAAACADWYATNRAVIGDDPDLIHPLQHLSPPLPKDQP